MLSCCRWAVGSCQSYVGPVTVTALRAKVDLGCWPRAQRITYYIWVWPLESSRDRRSCPRMKELQTCVLPLVSEDSNYA